MLLDISSTLLNTILILAGIWFIVFVFCSISIYKRNDLLLPIKIFWGAVILFAPVVGLVFYIIFGFNRGKKNNRSVTRTKRATM